MNKEDIIDILDMLIEDTKLDKGEIPDWDFYDNGNWIAMNSNLHKIREYINDGYKS